MEGERERHVLRITPEVRAAVDAVAPSRFARRRFRHVLVIERDPALVEQIRAAGCRVTCIADPRAVFLRRPKGPFDLVFLGPALSSRRISRQALSRLYGP